MGLWQFGFFSNSLTYLSSKGFFWFQQYRQKGFKSISFVSISTTPAKVLTGINDSIYSKDTSNSREAINRWDTIISKYGSHSKDNINNSDANYSRKTSCSRRI